MLMKRISTLVLTALMVLCGTSAWAQSSADYTVVSDLTGTKLQNADFASGTPVDVLVRTYAKDLADGGAGAGGVERYGQQAVPGWTAGRPSDNIKNNPSAVGGDACAGGLFPYLPDNSEGEETRPGLGGAFYPPFQSSEVSGNCLGLTAVWNANTVQYTQDVTLPAGAYMIVIKYVNVGAGTDIQKNLNGFIVSDTEQYLSTKLSYEVGMVEDVLSNTVSYTWSEDVIVFKLDAEKSGKISLGFASNDVGSAATAHFFVDNVKLYEIDPNDLIRDEINAKKVELLRLIEIGTAYGVDTSASQAVFDNPKATMEQVEAAIENQKKINDAGTTDFSEFFIQNPHFTLDEALNAGICTYAKDCATNEVPADHHGMMPVTGWNASQGRNVDGPASGIFSVGGSAFLGGTAFLPPTTMSDGSTTGKLLGICGSWSTEVAYTQYVSIPKGKYILSVSYYNSGGANAVNKNLIGFIEDNGTEHLCTTTVFPVGKWGTETIEFELTDKTSGRFSMGYKAAHDYSSTQPHFFIDGISLIYIGTGVNVSLIALKSAVENANNVLSNNEFYGDLMNELRTAVAQGQELINKNSEDDEANKAATAAIANLMPLVQENINAYQRLNDFYYEPGGELYEALMKYTDEKVYPNVLGWLGQYVSDVDNKLNYYLLSTEGINEMMANLKPNLVEKLQEDWQVYQNLTEPKASPIDISDLFTTLGATYSTSAVGGSGNAANVPDKQWNYGTATNFKTQYGTMEVWNQSPFEVTQTLTELPAGAYTIRTRGFYRTADNATNYTNYVEGDDRVFVIAGLGGKKALKNIAAFAKTETAEGWVEAVAESGMYVPNSQLAARNVFDSADFDEFTVGETTAVLGETGDLTFGISADQMDANCWVVWDKFEVLYNAPTENGLVTEIDLLMDRVLDLMNTDCQNVDAVYQALGEAYNTGSLKRTGVEECKNTIKVLNAAIAQGEQTLAAMTELTDVANFYDALSSKYSYESTQSEVFDLIDNALSGTAYYDDLKAVEDEKEKFHPAWCDYVLGQKMNAASEINPVDITGVILNPDFELLNFNYWNKGEEIGTNVGYQSNKTYADADGVTVIDHFMEAWVNSASATLGDGTMWQTIQTPLPKGYYKLEADAFAVNQKEGFDEDLHGIYLWATDDINESQTPITVAGDNSTVSKHFSIDVVSDGVTNIVVGVKIADTNANWFTIDNFTLSFVGTTPPVGIADVTEAAETLSVKSIYTPAGVRVSTLQRGINIVVGQDGQARKVVVK